MALLRRIFTARFIVTMRTIASRAKKCQVCRAEKCGYHDSYQYLMHKIIVPNYICILLPDRQ